MNGKSIVLCLLALTLLACTLSLSAQDQEKIVVTVKNSQVSNGVVIVRVLKGSKTIELQCNEGMSFCANLKAGKYQMVELPKNHGMYECRNVELYPEASEELKPEDKIGAYCIVD